MSETPNTSSDGEIINQKLAIALAEKYKDFIAMAVKASYGHDIVDLRVLTEYSFQIPENPKNVYFRVLHEKSNTMYGVIAEIMEDGSIGNYRCGIIPL
ncbi:hypothetical protein KKA13_02800 [Patescibacteria group bacterium]|nr:hypothetical protein [Patescibacteria group bacterium]